MGRRATWQGSVNKVISSAHSGLKDPEIRRTSRSARSPSQRRHSETLAGQGHRRAQGQKTAWHRVVIFSEGLCKIAEQKY